MTTYTTQYKLLFYLSWIGFYLIFPTWALPVSITIRFIIFIGLIIYFSISVYLMNLWLHDILIDKPFIIYPKDWLEHIKENLWVFIICCIAVVLHIYPIFFPILIEGDEAAHLQGGLGIYVYINNYWHKFFDFPIQYVFWALIGLMLLIIKQEKINNFINNLNTKLSLFPLKYLFIFLAFFAFITYFLFLRNLPYHPMLTRYPPLSKLLYLISYLFLGITSIGPRIVQLMFYVLGAIYLYRIIYLFKDKETALLGASIYLFSPLVFFYANFAEVACGTIFFIIFISYYFLRFIKNEDIRDLLLTSYFIGIGFLYKRSIFLMFFICILYLIFNKIKNKDLKLYLKVLLLSLTPIIPWLIIGKFFTWRKYEIIWSHFISFDKLISYFLMIPSEMSWIIFFFFLFSIAFVLAIKKDVLSLFFGFVFLAYYLFYTADITEKIDRFSMAFYPTIAVFLAQFISTITHKIKWKYSFTLIFSIFIIYLILICTIWQIPPLHAKYVTYKDIESRYFPSDKAMKWVKNNVRDGEKILILRVAPATFYRDKYGINRNKIIYFGYDLREVSTPHKLKTFCNKNKISYIMFSYSRDEKLKIMKYLKANRHNEFIEIAKFSLDKNYIFIYKIKKLIKFPKSS